MYVRLFNIQGSRIYCISVIDLSYSNTSLAMEINASGLLHIWVSYSRTSLGMELNASWLLNPQVYRVYICEDENIKLHSRAVKNVAQYNQIRYSARNWKWVENMFNILTQQYCMEGIFELYGKVYTILSFSFAQRHINLNILDSLILF